MVDWTPEAIEAAHRAMFQEPYDGTTAAMIGAGLDASAAAQGIKDEEITRLREENARLRKALKPFARMEDRCLGRHDVDYEYVLISHIRAAAAAIREGGRDE